MRSIIGVLVFLQFTRLSAERGCSEAKTAGKAERDERRLVERRSPFLVRTLLI